MSKNENLSILFVCLGNICRSPMAEGVFKNMVKQYNIDQISKIDSAGLSDFHSGELPDSRSSAICEKNGIKLETTSRQITTSDFQTFDYILCMDESNLSQLERLQPKGSKAKIELFGSYDPLGERIIKDPYYGGNQGFQKNFEQCQRASVGFLKAKGLLKEMN